MFDLVPRPDRYGDDPPEPTTIDELIQARIDGRLSRRAMIRKALQIGIAAPVVGIMLHATSDMAFGAPTQNSETRTEPFQAKQTVPADKPTKPAGEPKQGGTLTVATNEEPDTLNPWLTQLVTGTDVVVGVIDPLLAYDSNEKLQPALATEMSVSKDGLTYTFTLRDGVTFHNGDKFTGDDVINSWKMIMNPDFGAFNTNGWDKVTDIKADGNSLTIVTKEVYAPFLSYVGPTSIVPTSSLKAGADKFKQDYGRAPIGTGPFKFNQWQAKQQITLDRFDGYWGNKPKLDKIIYKVVPDDNTQLVQLRTGEAQLSGSAGALPASRVDEALAIPNLIVLEHATQAWSHIDLKQWDFLRMTKVRQALDFATPSQQIIDKLLKGRALPSVADQAPGTWAFDDSVKPRPYDVDQAKKLMAEAGLTPGGDGTLQGKVPTNDPNVGDGEVKPFEIELWYVSGSSDTERVAQVIGQSWNSIGVKTTLKNQDVSTIWGPEGYQFTKQMTGCFFSWYNGNDPTDTFYWASSQIPKTPTGTGGNLPAYFFKYSFQDQIDKLCAEGDTTVDQDARKKIYSQIQALLHEEVPVVFIYWGKAFPAVKDNVGGFWPSAFTNLLWNAQDWYLT